jgi:hypothetical protein
LQFCVLSTSSVLSFLILFKLMRSSERYSFLFRRQDVQWNEQASLSYLANPYELFSEHRNSLVLSYACCEIGYFYPHINCKLATHQAAFFQANTLKSGGTFRSKASHSGNDNRSSKPHIQAAPSTMEKEGRGQDYNSSADKGLPAGFETQKRQAA